MILILAGAFALSLGDLVVPNFIRARTATAANACINSLRQIEGAKEQWALENHKATNDAPAWDDIRPYLGHGAQGDLSGLHCQNGGTFTVGRVADPPTCSIRGPNHSLN